MVHDTKYTIRHNEGVGGEWCIDIKDSLLVWMREVMMVA